MKRRINVTIERDLLRAARHVAAERGRSLSGLIEGEIKRLIDNAPDLPRAPDGEHWLDRFHRTYLPKAGTKDREGDDE